MIFKKLLNKKNKNIFENSVLDGIEKLKNGEKTYIKIVFSGLVQGNTDLSKKIGREISSFLEEYSFEMLIELCKNFREYTSLEWYGDWSNLSIKKIKEDLDDEKYYFYILVLGSCHPNGYFRQRCMEELLELPGSLPFIVLRLNDWVWEVRKRSSELINKKIETCPIHELVNSLFTLSMVKDYYNKEIYKYIEQRIEKEIVNVSVKEILEYEFQVRKNLYKIILSKKILEKKDIDLLLCREKNNNFKARIIECILNFYDSSQDTIESYISNRSSVVRMKAIDLKFSRYNKLWDGIEDGLLDKSVKVRKLVLSIIKENSDFDILDFYIKALEGKNFNIAVLGIGENGNKDQGDLLKPYLETENTKIIRTILFVFRKIMGTDGKELFWSYLFDSRPEISKSAYLCIKGNSIKYGAEILFYEYKNCDIYHIKRYLAMLLMNENSWERLPYLMDIYFDRELVDLQIKMENKITNRSMYSSIGSDKVELIKKVMLEKQNMFREDILKGIYFDLKQLQGDKTNGF